MAIITDGQGNPLYDTSFDGVEGCPDESTAVILDTQAETVAAESVDSGAFINQFEFNALLFEVAQEFWWRKATQCPCIDEYSGQPEPDCKYCSGKGYIWGDPMCAHAGVISQAQARKITPIGLMEVGDIMVSIPSDSAMYEIGSYDRAQMRNRTEPFTMTVIAGANDVLRFTPTRIDSVHWIDAASKEFKTGTIPEINGGRLVWSGTVPPTGQRYTLTGRRYPEYYCYQEQPLDRPHQFGEPLPRRVVLKRFDVLGR